MALLRLGRTAAVVLLAVTLCSPAWSQRSDLEGKHNCSKGESGVPPDAKIDTAFITIQNLHSDGHVEFWSQSLECQGCDLQWRFKVPKNSNKTCLIDTRYATKWNVTLVVQDKDTTTLCLNKNEHFTEGGRYSMTLMEPSLEKSQTRLQFSLLNNPPDNNIPILVAFGVFVAMAVLWIVAKFLYRRRVHLMVCTARDEQLITSDLGEPTSINPGAGDQPPRKQRLRSLDTFRGLSIVVMIFVNYGGGKYWFFHHSTWNGLTVADLVFPWFMFIMGTSMALSFRGLMRRNEPRSKILYKILRRTVILFALGLFLESAGRDLPDVKTLRVPGVLQRFAVAYFVNAMLELFFARAADPDPEESYAAVRDVLDFWPEWLVNLALVALWVLVTFLLPVPGCQTGYLGPGGLDDGGKHMNCTAGAAGYIDRWLLGVPHIYGRPTCKDMYKSLAHDPEGILGSCTTVFMTFLGLQMGKIILYFPSPAQRLKRFAFWGVLLGGIAALLCEGKKDGGFIPLNKNLWSLSFVLALAGMAYILFGLFYILIDVVQLWTGAPFYYPGMNPLFLYVCSEAFHHNFPVHWRVPSTHAALLAMDLWGPTFWTIIGVYMYYKDIFIIL